MLANCGLILGPPFVDFEALMHLDCIKAGTLFSKQAQLFVVSVYEFDFMNNV